MTDNVAARHFSIRKVAKLVPDPLYAFLSHWKHMGRPPKLWRPTTLNEKIVWLKLFDRRCWHKLYADKVAVKDVISCVLGKNYVIPTLAVYDSVEEAKLGISKVDFPFIIKPNHDSGGGYIVKAIEDLDEIDWVDLDQRLARDYSECTQELQYKGIKPKLLVERLLVDEEGKIPNDYKMHVINGRVAFTYVSIDREGQNYRKIYNNDWQNEGMQWGPRKGLTEKFSGPDVEPPSQFAKMKWLAEKISAGFCYIRVDFFELDGRVYVGELTQHQSSGNYPIFPKELDVKYGKMLRLYKSPENIPSPCGALANFNH